MNPSALVAGAIQKRLEIHNQSVPKEARRAVNRWKCLDPTLVGKPKTLVVLAEVVPPEIAKLERGERIQDEEEEILQRMPRPNRWESDGPREIGVLLAGKPEKQKPASEWLPLQGSKPVRSVSSQEER